eukprot:1171411-Alexandrium_andersonii.AAC.1
MNSKHQSPESWADAQSGARPSRAHLHSWSAERSGSQRNRRRRKCGGLRPRPAAGSGSQPTGKGPSTGAT